MKNRLRKYAIIAAAVGLFMVGASNTYAGPFILAGTDADDHGFVSGGVNQDGWFFMQRALENLGSGVTNGNKKVAILGSTSSAATAANSAFDLSGLVGLGWSRYNVSSTSFAAFFGGTAAAGFNVSDMGLLMMDSDGNVGGGIAGSAFTPYASGIDTFVGGGGGLFSQANGYAWLSALLPGVTAPNEFNTGLSLTAAGTAAFPGLNNGDLSAGPYHNRFLGYGAIPVLATSNVTGNAIIIGASGGSITVPSVPDAGSTLALLGLGIVGLSGLGRRFKA